MECFIRCFSWKSRATTSTTLFFRLFVHFLSLACRPSRWHATPHQSQFPYTLCSYVRVHNLLIPLYFRYKNLNNTAATRGKVLQAAVHSLQSFDKSLDQVSKQFVVLSCIHSFLSRKRKRVFNFIFEKNKWAAATKKFRISFSHATHNQIYLLIFLPSFHIFNFTFPLNLNFQVLRMAERGWITLRDGGIYGKNFYCTFYTVSSVSFLFSK